MTNAITRQETIVYKTDISLVNRLKSVFTGKVALIRDEQDIRNMEILIASAKKAMRGK